MQNFRSLIFSRYSRRDTANTISEETEFGNTKNRTGLGLPEQYSDFLSDQGSKSRDPRTTKKRDGTEKKKKKKLLKIRKKSSKDFQSESSDKHILVIMEYRCNLVMCCFRLG